MIRNNEILKEMSFDEIFKFFPSGYKFKNSFRRELWRAHNKVCAYCGEEIETYIEMHIDHFEPKSNLGGNDISNLICACRKCNLTKGNRDLDDFRFCLSLSKSILGGVIQASIAKKIIDAGVSLPIDIIEFHFEKILGDKNV